MDFEECYSDIFEKIPLDEIFEFDDITGIINDYCKDNNIKNVEQFHKKVNSWFTKMRLENNNEFSYKYIPIIHRDLIRQSIQFAVKWLDDEFDKLTEILNDKDVLILDDTVATGKTLSDTAEAIRTTFAPRSITFLTLFSPKSSQEFSNARILF